MDHEVVRAENREWGELKPVCDLPPVHPTDRANSHVTCFVTERSLYRVKGKDGSADALARAAFEFGLLTRSKALDLGAHRLLGAARMAVAPETRGATAHFTERHDVSSKRTAYAAGEDTRERRPVG